MIGFVKSVNRIATQVGKELIQVRRRPGAFISLVLGPFMIMAIFGLGYTGVHRPLDAVIVLPADSVLAREPEFYEQFGAQIIDVLEVTDDADWAHAQLEGQSVDMVVYIPDRLTERFRQGEQAELLVEINQIDPVAAAYADFMARHVSQEVNREILTRAVEEGVTYAQQAGEDVPTQLRPELVAQPTTTRLVNVAPYQPTVVSFAAPAVLALILQHMAVTLSALSFVRERLSGALELFRVSPVTPFELVLGKYVGLGILSAIVAAITVGLLVYLLGVPLLGDPWLLAGIVALLIFGSLGLGLLISVISDSERQAVQLALLLLIASVFFSGFVLPVEEFRPEMQPLAYALPVTHGIVLLQDVMLRGWVLAWWHVWVLAGTALGLLVLTSILLRRLMSHG
ncbi:MAG TPA: ABC transporter permease [Candidatus Limnocylindria bacterium]|jgi:ABC-2 type transport system permease protein|nr:ABC transporter permease [Candidatus Limnocylindria bacterium]